MNKETKKQTILGYLFLIPSLAVFAVFMFYPLLYTFYLSFFEWNMVKPVKKFVGLNNYIAVFRDPNTFKILGNTLAYILVLLVLNFVLPYILSFAAGAMLYVVIEELIPESQNGDHSNIGTIGAALGFALMLILDVALG